MGSRTPDLLIANGNDSVWNTFALWFWFFNKDSNLFAFLLLRFGVETKTLGG